MLRKFSFGNVGSPRDLLSVRNAVSLVAKICVLVVLFASYQLGETTVARMQFALPSAKISDAPDANSAPPAATLDTYHAINARNLFGGRSAPPPAPVPEISQQKLRLVGTNAVAGDRGFAIVEDLNKKEQDVFAKNELIFGKAKLVQILNDSIRIEVNGKVETLVLDEGSKESAGGGPAVDEEGSDFVVQESELSDALGNLPLLLSQARAVPYFRNGQSIGMRLFAIRKDSLYEKLGLKNGDILTAVNDSSLSDPSQALKLFEQLKTERSINVKLERNGEQKDLHYAIR